MPSPSATSILRGRKSTRTSISVLAVALAGCLAPAARAPTVKIRVPPGFKVDVYASGIKHPTAMAFSSSGLLFVTNDIGRLVVARESAHKGLVVASGLRTPLGLAFRNESLYVSEQGRIEQFELTPSCGSNRSGRACPRFSSRRTLVRRLPFGLHQQDNIVLGTDDRLYFGSGSTCDACRERDRRSAAILSMRPNGSDLRIVARGLRNPFGLAFKPGTDRLYASVNGQDLLGAAEPAETVVRVQNGADYGWPRCWPSYRQRRLVGSCRGVTPPAAYLEPHSSADGLAFWRGDLYVALWGEYLSRKHGRRVVRIQFAPNGKVRRVTDFATGFDHPLALQVDDADNLLVADWGRGTIYRIQSRGG